jgi:hypothetical protein
MLSRILNEGRLIDIQIEPLILNVLIVIGEYSWTSKTSEILES